LDIEVSRAPFARRSIDQMSLAFRNLLHDRIRFLVTALGVAFAVFLMIFQGSLLIGFLGAAAEIIDAADSTSG